MRSNRGPGRAGGTSSSPRSRDRPPNRCIVRIADDAASCYEVRGRSTSLLRSMRTVHFLPLRIGAPLRRAIPGAHPARCLHRVVIATTWAALTDVASTAGWLACIMPSSDLSAALVFSSVSGGETAAAGLQEGGAGMWDSRRLALRWMLVLLGMLVPALASGEQVLSRPPMRDHGIRGWGQICKGGPVVICHKDSSRPRNGSQTVIILLQSYPIGLDCPSTDNDARQGRHTSEQHAMRRRRCE